MRLVLDDTDILSSLCDRLPERPSFDDLDTHVQAAARLVEGFGGAVVFRRFGEPEDLEVNVPELKPYRSETRARVSERGDDVPDPFHTMDPCGFKR